MQKAQDNSPRKQKTPSQDEGVRRGVPTARPRGLRQRHLLGDLGECIKPPKHTYPSTNDAGTEHVAGVRQSWPREHSWVSARHWGGPRTMAETERGSTGRAPTAAPGRRAAPSLPPCPLSPFQGLQRGGRQRWLAWLPCGPATPDLEHTAPAVLTVLLAEVRDSSAFPPTPTRGLAPARVPSC